MRADLATQITDKLLDLMQQHGTNWRQPWVGQGLQRNAVSKKPYRGVNTVILALTGHASPFYATYKQWSEMGAQVRRGEKATAIFFWKPYAIKDREAEEEKQIMLVSTITLFDGMTIAEFDVLPASASHRL